MKLEPQKSLAHKFQKQRPIEQNEHQITKYNQPNSMEIQ